MNVLNKKISGSKPFLYAVVILLFAGCNKLELLLPHYESRDVEGFENLVLTGRQNSVLAQWNRLGEEDVDYILVRYMDETANGESLQTRRYARDRQEISINNLQNFKEYEFTFMVVDNYGNTSDSIVANATPIAEITNIFATGGETEGAVNIIWEDPEDPYDTFNGVFFYDASDNLLASVDRGVEAVTLTGLPSGQEVGIKAKIRLGTDFYSSGIQFTVNPRVVLPPPGEVTDLVVKGKTNVLELTWENPSDANFAFVEIYWGAGTDQAQATNFIQSQPEPMPGGRMKIVIPDLTNETQYVVLIKTSDTHGNASDGTWMTGTPKNTTYDGNISINSQADLDNYNGDITYIKGNLTISNFSAIVTLDKFNNLDSITGNFLYQNNSAYDYEIDDFSGLQKVGGNMEFVSIWPDRAVVLPQLREVGGAFMVRYFNLNTIAAPALERVGGEMYFLGSAPNLTTLEFSSLERVGGQLLFAILPNITDLNGFSALNHVGGNFVIGVGRWGATGSSQACGFTNLCGIRPLMQSGFIGGTVTIEQIPIAPITRADIAAGNCSQ